MKKRILIIDDDEAVLRSCRLILTDEGYQVQTAGDGASGLDVLRQQAFDLVLTDLKMPGMSGIETLRAAKGIDPEIVAIIFTAYGTIETAVAAIKAGAFNYLTKPFRAAELVVAVQKALEYSDLVRENQLLREEVSARFEGIIGKSRVMESTLRLLAKVAPSGANILITGESGTGKELAARSIHANSRRTRRPFVPVDCAAIPETLLESELFGHERGAFTGADRRRRGLFEQADGGTLYLDEIGEMDLALQARLLRTLQERSFRPLGGDKLITVDIRLVSSTNRDLKAEVRKGNFREDLLFRLDVVHLEMPPVRQRKGDIPLLCGHFLDQLGQREKTAPLRLTPDALAALESYAWPGNVRELQNVIERAVVLNECGVIDVSDLPDHLLRPDRIDTHSQQAGGYHEARAAWTDAQGKRYITELLVRHRGNVSSAAREARISRKTLYELLHKFDVNHKDLGPS